MRGWFTCVLFQNSPPGGPPGVPPSGRNPGGGHLGGPLGGGPVKSGTCFFKFYV